MKFDFDKAKIIVNPKYVGFNDALININRYYESIGRELLGEKEEMFLADIFNSRATCDYLSIVQSRYGINFNPYPKDLVENPPVGFKYNVKNSGYFSHEDKLKNYHALFEMLECRKEEFYDGDIEDLDLMYANTFKEVNKKNTKNDYEIALIFLSHAFDGTIYIQDFASKQHFCLKMKNYKNILLKKYGY